MKSILPWSNFSASSIEEADVIIMGVTFDGAVSIGKGAAAASEYLRGLSKILPPATGEGMVFPGLHIRDEGNVPAHLYWEQYFGEINKRAYIN